MKQSFEQRTQKVPMKNLASWFGDPDGKCEFEVKALNSHEMALVQRTAEDAAVLRQTASMLASVNNAKAKELESTLGISAIDTPDSLAKRLKLVQLGLISPKLSTPEVVKLAEVRWAEFTILSNVITELSGEGYLEKK